MPRFLMLNGWRCNAALRGAVIRRRDVERL